MTIQATVHLLAASRRLDALDEAAGPMPPCPAWCIEPAGHRWDSLTDVGGQLLREHQGPDLGDWASVGATEVQGSSQLQYDARVEIMAQEVADPALLRQMAANLAAAAEWLEAQA